MNTVQGPKSHEVWMGELVGWTRRASATPFGCFLVDRETDSVVAEGLNQSQMNPIWHAEIVAIRRYAKSERPLWDRVTLYSTAEPCPMCMSAILWAGIAETVYGTSIQTLMRRGYRQIEIGAQQVVASSWADHATVAGAVLEAECDNLFPVRNAELLTSR
ncbi:MAG: nucleoside deaminase [Pirellulales bacterium]|nr:nucleoside deaminase [Pirellulales bacterium]